MDFGLIGIGAAIAFAAIGSALGTGSAGMAAVGAWKKCFLQNKPAPFILVAFVGFPLSQTIYGYLLMNRLSQAVATANAGYILGAGVLGGIAIGMSAWFQGRAAAAASDAMGETGKGTGNYIFVLGIIETVALFVMVFLFLITGTFEG